MRWRSVVRGAVAGAVALIILAAENATGKKKAVGHGAASSGPKVQLNDDFFTRWSSYKDLELFMSMLAREHKKDKVVKLTTIGKSAEHRSLTLMSIGPLGDAAPKYQLMLMGAMHGREWISPHAVVYLGYQLLRGLRDGDERTQKLLSETQVHLLPLLNPDGYEFTRIPAEKNDQAREWRKNRRNLCSKCERGVHGIDLNRNWGIKGRTWGFGNDRATAEVYQGKRPFSEPEIKAVRDFLLKHDRGKSINGFMDVHCCSGEVLPPFYYNDESDTVKQGNLANCKAIAKAMKSVNKARYRGRPREKEFSDSNTGIGLDWIYGEAGVQNAFMVETRGNKTKLLKYIFEVPEDFILPICKELEAGFWKMAEIVTPLFNPETKDKKKAAAAAAAAAAAKEQPSQPAKVSNERIQQKEEKIKQIQPQKPFQKPSKMSLDDILSNFKDTFESPMDGHKQKDGPAGLSMDEKLFEDINKSHEDDLESVQETIEQEQEQEEQEGEATIQDNQISEMQEEETDQEQVEEELVQEEQEEKEDGQEQDVAEEKSLGENKVEEQQQSWMGENEEENETEEEAQVEEEQQIPSFEENVHNDETFVNQEPSRLIPQDYLRVQEDVQEESPPLDSLAYEDAAEIDDEQLENLANGLLGQAGKDQDNERVTAGDVAWPKELEDLSETVAGDHKRSLRPKYSKLLHEYQKAHEHDDDSLFESLNRGELPSIAVQLTSTTHRPNKQLVFALLGCILLSFFLLLRRKKARRQQQLFKKR